MPSCPDRLSCLALTATLLVGAAVASAGGRSVTLREAEEMALERNPQVASARAAVTGAKAGVTQARATILPNVSLGGGYTRNVELPVMFLPPPIGTRAIGDTNTYQLALNLNQPLFLGFAGITGVHLAQTNRASAELGLEQTRQSVISSVREAYLGAVLARSTVRVQEEAVAQAESSLAQVQLRFNVGAASGFDLLRARVQLATIRPGLVSARSNRDIADAQLRVAIGLEPTEPVMPSDTLAGFVSRWANLSVDSLIHVAYRNRPDLQQTEYQERRARDQVKLAQSPYYPMVSAYGRAQWQAQSSKLSLKPDFIRSTSVGLNLSWTLWDSWKTPSGVQIAQVGVRQVSYTMQLLRNAVAAEVEGAHLKLREAAVNVQSEEQTVGQAAEALRLARVLYAEGGSTQLDVINAQVALTQARTQYVQTLYQYHVAHIRLEKALGIIGRES